MYEENALTCFRVYSIPHILFSMIFTIKDKSLKYK